MCMRFTLAVALSLVLGGCATMEHGRYETIELHSEPEGASVALDCGSAPRHPKLVTPAAIEIPRSAENCTITFLRDGYLPKTVKLERKIASETARNFGGVVAAGEMVTTDCCHDDFWMALSFATFLGGVAYGGVGVAIDHATGAMYEHVPQLVDVQLELDEEYEEVE